MSAFASPESEPERRFVAGEVLFRAGDPATHLYVVRSGSVRVSLVLGEPSTAPAGAMPAPHEVTVAMSGPGEIIGGEALATGVHATTATAAADTEAVAVDASTLEAMLSEDPILAVRIVRALMLALGTSHERLALLARPSAGRLALVLARLAESIGTMTPEGTVIPRRLRELASDVGLDEEALGATATVLIRERLLRVGKHGIVVPDLARMYDFVKTADADVHPSEERESVRSHGA